MVPGVPATKHYYLHQDRWFSSVPLKSLPSSGQRFCQPLGQIGCQGILEGAGREASRWVRRAAGRWRPTCGFCSLGGPGGLEGAEVTSSGQWWLPAVPHPFHAELAARAPGEGPRAAGPAVFRARAPLPSAPRGVRVSSAALSSTAATMEAQAQGGCSSVAPEVWS